MTTLYIGGGLTFAALGLNTVELLDLLGMPLGREYGGYVDLCLLQYGQRNGLFQDPAPIETAAAPPEGHERPRPAPSRPFY
jgi:hypothetical protein